MSQWPRFRLIILQSFVQRITGFDLSTTSSHEPRCVSTGSVRKQIYVIASVLNSNSCPTHQLKLCNWVKLIRHVSLLRMSHRTLLGTSHKCISSWWVPQWAVLPRLIPDLAEPQDQTQHRLSQRILPLPSLLPTLEVSWFYLYLVLLSSWIFIHMEVRIFGSSLLAPQEGSPPDLQVADHVDKWSAQISSHYSLMLSFVEKHNSSEGLDSGY